MLFFNSSEQFILLGHSNALEEAMALLKENRILSRRLDVSAPFHSSHQQKCNETSLEDTVFFENENQIIANVTGQAIQRYQAEYLIRQI